MIELSNALFESLDDLYKCRSNTRWFDRSANAERLFEMFEKAKISKCDFSEKFGS